MDDDTEPIPLLKNPAERQAEEAEKQRRRDETRQGLQFVFNAILVVATVATAGIVVYQNLILRDTLNEIRKQSIAAQTSADAAKSQANSAADTIRAAQSANEIAAASVAIAREQTHVGQRAYLLIEDAGGANAEVGKPFSLPVLIRNTGQTPAKSARIQSGIVTRSRTPFTLAEVGFKEGLLNSMNDIGANQTRRVAVSFNDSSPLDTGMAQLIAFYTVNRSSVAAPAAKVYMVVVITYADVFGGTGRTVHCSVLDAGKFALCDFLNEVR